VQAAAKAVRTHVDGGPHDVAVFASMQSAVALYSSTNF
jgi:hypothetical protein